ncbi:MAG: D-alanine--D-alanine ligase family protein [Peptococcaceae bacterium]|nr:D-alanine--D-alanine ligase family protein [Peptococcaceae bacterium]
MLDKNLKIGVIFGGPSGEYDVSCVSANTIVSALKDAGYKQVFPIGVAKDGRWYGPVAAEDVAHFDAKAYADQELIFPQYPGGVMRHAKNFDELGTLDVIFPIIHGSYGEDGHLQAFFDMCRIPYVGAGMMGSVVGMDKVFMRDILKAHDIPQTDYVAVLRYDVEKTPETVLDDIEASLTYPMFVKPSCLGSSVGISKVLNRDMLLEALNIAGKYDSKLIVETGVNAREIETALLGNNEVEMAVPGEIITEGVFYDYESKYILDNSETKTPADLSQDQIDTLAAIGKKTYKILHLSGMCRADFFIDKDNGRILLNEVNTLPGFTSISMYAKMWQASGKPLIDVIEKLIALAFEKHQDDMRNYTVFGG